MHWEDVNDVYRNKTSKYLKGYIYVCVASSIVIIVNCKFTPFFFLLQNIEITRKMKKLAC